MQHMDSSDEEAGHNWQREYGRYEGPGQKIKDDDELFASMLARKMKRELENERNTLSVQRLVLGIVSVCAVVVLFGLLVLALALKVASSGEASAALGWGFAVTCAVIFAVNGFFNVAGRVPDKTATSGQEKKDDQVMPMPVIVLVVFIIGVPSFRSIGVSIADGEREFNASVEGLL